MRKKLKLNVYLNVIITQVFFHAVLQKKQQNQVTKMFMFDGTLFNSPEAIHEGVVHNFLDFLSHRFEGVLPDLSLIINKVIMEVETKNITKSPALEEVWQALFSIPVESSPGPNEFRLGFF